MITGRLQEKNGRYYMILNLKDELGKYKPKHCLKRGARSMRIEEFKRSHTVKTIWIIFL